MHVYPTGIVSGKIIPTTVRLIYDANTILNHPSLTTGGIDPTKIFVHVFYPLITSTL